MDIILHAGTSVRRIFLLVSLTVFAVLMAHVTATAAGPQGTRFGYDECTGHLYAEYYSSNDYCDAPDDYLRWGNLYYKNAAGSWVILLDGSFIGRYGSNKFFEATHVPGTVRGFSSDRYPVVNGDGACNAEYRARIVLFNMPTDAKYPYELRLYMNWIEEHTFGSDDIYEQNHDSGPIETQSLTTHTTLSASNTQCGQVVLTWDNPTQAWESGSGCSVGSAKYFNLDLNGSGYGGTGLSQPNAGNKLSTIAEYFTDIYKNDVLIATVAGNVNTYTDASVADYTQYNYRLRRRLQYKNFAWNTTNFYNVTCSGSCSNTAVTPTVPERGSLIRRWR